MSDGATLVDFATWAMETYPADNYVLILSDHGMGWPGGWSDPAPGGAGDRKNPLSQVVKDQLFWNDLTTPSRRFATAPAWTSSSSSAWTPA